MGKHTVRDESRSARRRRGVRRFLRAYSFVALTGLAAMWYGYSPAGFDRAVLRSDSRVTVSTHDGARTFAPRGSSSRAGLLFLPGALVNADAYAPLARAVAERGYAVTILPLPFRAALSAGRTERVLESAAKLLREDHSGRRWVIAGHSRGGVLAARLARAHPELLHGVVLLGTTHPHAADDLSESPLPVTKVYGTRDGVATPSGVMANRSRLPPGTRWVRIEGGNHAQFGYYRYQLKDHGATISRDEQARIVVGVLRDALAAARADAKRGDTDGRADEGSRADAQKRPGSTGAGASGGANRNRTGE